ncbi:aminoglycoside 6-adenylyltransferase [Aliagarivorans marinus]|uniref:aminoglycoside 6-adenylyltransferase n=1 Tax=Aliagarivorans marinus TaxID=561965 RepID=UPI0004038D42|nr:aminoglycoside 6-adenylyltransferase [Aliagarivorans marinus]
MIHPQYQALGDRLISFASTREDIRAAFVVGSQARESLPADRWSDIDILLVVEDPACLMQERSWTEALGQVVLCFSESSPVDAVPELRVLYQPCLDVDFPLLPADFVRARDSAQLSPEMIAVFKRGYLCLLDKENFASIFAEVAALPLPAPKDHAEEVTELIQDIAYHVLWTAKKWQRGERWMALACCNSHIQHRLLRLMEWMAHSQTQNQEVIDTWHNGRFIEQWLPEPYLELLSLSWARADKASLQAALQAALALCIKVLELAGEAEKALKPSLDHCRERLGELLNESP